MAEVLVVVGLCLTHLGAPRLLRLTERAVPDPAPIAQGLAVAYVFLHLIPEIGDGLAERGLLLAWMLLAGFLLFDLVEIRIRQSPRPRVRRSLQFGMAAALSWLIGTSLPEAVVDRPAEALLVLSASALHLLERHRGMEGGPPPAAVRAVLAAFVVAGLVADELWVEAVTAVDQVLVALVAGGILITVFRDHFELARAERRFLLLASSALGYGAVLTLVSAG